MNIKKKLATFGKYIFFGVIVIIFLLPLLLLYFLFKLLILPIDYIIYKRSRYQKDFPKKFRWLDTPHTDNRIYTIIKENDLPIEYIKWRKDYDLHGDFIYKDTLLVFYEPMFFDKDKELWLCWAPKNIEETPKEDDSDYENTDDCFTVDETKNYILEEFHNNVPNRVCNQVVFFYSRENAVDMYKKDGLEKMLELDDFIVYEKKELPEVLKEFVATH